MGTVWCPLTTEFFYFLLTQFVFFYYSCQFFFQFCRKYAEFFTFSDNLFLVFSALNQHRHNKNSKYEVFKSCYFENVQFQTEHDIGTHL